MYKRGPQLLGFHESLPDADICARISGTPAHLWLARDECEDLILRRVRAYVVLMQFVFILYLLLSLFNVVVRVGQVLVVRAVSGYDLAPKTLEAS